MAKLAIPANSKFDPHRAMEMANLIQRAYEQFNCYKDEKIWGPAVSGILRGSTTCDEDLDQPSPEGKVAYELCEAFESTQRTIFDPIERRFFVSERVPFGFIVRRELENGNMGVFIVFRGTLTTAEWFNNFQFNQEPFLSDDRLGLVSEGFQNIYSDVRDGTSLEKMVAETLQKMPQNAQVFVTGHSLGGALATLATVHISSKTRFKKPILYSFASPRVGDTTFAAQFDGLEHYRIANSEDLVPAVPPSTGRLAGPEIATPSARKNVDSIKQLKSIFRRNLTDQIYQHTGEPLYFTEQRGYLSTNHNLFNLYRKALP